MTSDIYSIKRFDSALYAICDEIKSVLIDLPPIVKTNAQEIRLRSGQPLILTVGGAPMWVSTDAKADYLVPKNPLYCTAEQINKIYINLCNHSVYSHTEEINQGFIMMRGSHRAGVCGTVFSGGMRDISSINIRISKEIKGCADKLLEGFDGKGMLIAGPPGSGKTTLLRDMVRQLSHYRNRRITVIDSRGEIAAVYSATPENDIGENTDVITGVEKAIGIEMAVRTMYPQIVAFDEIGSQGEIDMILHALNCGVSVLTTAHIGGKDDLCRRDVTSKLLKSGAISKIALLTRAGDAARIIDAREVL